MSEKAPLVRLCEGKSCSKKTKAQSALRELLDGRARVQPVRCQKICDGPVVGLTLDGTLEWLRDMDGKKAREGLRIFLDEGRLKKRLNKRRVEARAGRLRE